MLCFGAGSGAVGMGVELARGGGPDWPVELGFGARSEIGRERPSGATYAGGNRSLTSTRARGWPSMTNSIASPIPKVARSL